MESIAINDIPALVNYMAEKMEEHRAGLAELDAETGDGDLGVTIALIFRALTRCVKKWNDATALTDAFFEMSEAVEEYAPSTFGTFTATMLCSMSNKIKSVSVIDGAVLATMLVAAAEGVMQRGGAKLGDKTLLDALIPAGEVAVATAEQGGGLAAVTKCAAEAARQGAEHTEHLKATTGRAGYMGERTIGSRDPGAETIALMMGLISDYFNS